MEAFDTEESCYHCPHRAIGCHATCAGYAKREAEKKQRYEKNAMKANERGYIGQRAFENRVSCAKASIKKRKR